jgi:hypothetical protein
MKIFVKNAVLSVLLTLAVGLIMPAFAQSPPSANGAIASIAGTTWSGADSLGRHYDYEFLADGILHYTYENGSYTDGTWKQDGDSIYMSMNNKYSERQGRITGTHMEGKAWNVKGKEWTWAADKRSPPATPAP